MFIENIEILFKVCDVKCNKKDEWGTTFSWTGPVPVLYLNFDCVTCVEHHGTELRTLSNVSVHVAVQMRKKDVQMHKNTNIISIILLIEFFHK